MTTLPSLFISHGAPTLALEDGPAHRYLAELGAKLPASKAILVVSAHYDARIAELSSSEQPATIYDFNGFPEALYQLIYPAPGEPALAADIAARLRSTGIEARLNPNRGLDHGAWVPLRLLYPNAAIPVVQLSINMAETARYHYRLGQALAPLRDEGILLIGSGSATHNLREYFQGGYDHDTPPPAWVSAFADWLADRVEANDVEAVLRAVEDGPHGQRNHPTMDHIHPLFFALGAAADAATDSRRLHTSTTYGVLAMDVYGFGETTALRTLAV